MPKITLAIDPGAAGGYALHNSSASIPVVTGNLPESDSDLIAFLGEQQDHADVLELVIERVNPHTGDIGMAASMAKLYGHKRFIEGAAMAIGYRVINVMPKEWQEMFGFGKKPKKKVMRKGVEKEVNDNVAWKNRLKDEAQRRFPCQRVTLHTADALLMLEWAMHKFGGGGSEAARLGGPAA